jgi:trehalose synthase
VALPMSSQKHNALLVNALQRCSDVVAQNSLQEGFGLTATEAMWKRVAVMGTRAAGLRQQIRHGLDGCLVENPEDPDEIARTLRDLLCDQRRREALAGSGQQRVHDQFLVFTHVRRWLEVLADVVRARWP